MPSEPGFALHPLWEQTCRSCSRRYGIGAFLERPLIAQFADADPYRVFVDQARRCECGAVVRGCVTRPTLDVNEALERVAMGDVDAARRALLRVVG